MIKEVLLFMTCFISFHLYFHIFAQNLLRKRSEVLWKVATFIFCYFIPLISLNSEKNFISQLFPLNSLHCTWLLSRLYHVHLHVCSHIHAHFHTRGQGARVLVVVITRLFWLSELWKSRHLLPTNGWQMQRFADIQKFPAPRRPTTWFPILSESPTVGKSNVSLICRLFFSPAFDGTNWAPPMVRSHPPLVTWPKKITK